VAERAVAEGAEAEVAAQNAEEADQGTRVNGGCDGQLS